MLNEWPHEWWVAARFDPDTHSHAHFVSVVVVVAVVLSHTQLTHCTHFSTFMVRCRIDKSFHQVIMC